MLETPTVCQTLGVDCITCKRVRIDGGTVKTLEIGGVRNTSRNIFSLEVPDISFRNSLNEFRCTLVDRFVSFKYKWTYSVGEIYFFELSSSIQS